MWYDLLQWLGPDFYWIPYVVIAWVIASGIWAVLLCMAASKDTHSRNK